MRARRKQKRVFEHQSRSSTTPESPSYEVFDTYKCILGEGAFWHPKLNQFFWFDIEGKKLFTKSNHKTKIWSFKEMPSACSWIDNALTSFQFKLIGFLHCLDT